MDTRCVGLDRRSLRGGVWECVYGVNGGGVGWLGEVKVCG